MTIGIIIENISYKAGTERAVSNLANILNNVGHKVNIYSMYSNNGQKSGFYLDKNIKVTHLTYQGNSKQRYFSYLKLIKYINSLNDVDVFIGTTHAINCMLALSHTNAKKIGCEHFNYNQCPKVWRIIRKRFYPKLDAVVVLTKHDAMHYSFINPNKLYVIQNSISKASDNLCDITSKTIISVGRLSYQKGFDLLLDVAKLVQKDLPDWKFEIYGDGEDKPKLLDKCKKLGLENYVFFKGRTDNVSDKMGKSSIYLMTSRFEGLPMVLIEAQSCGLPIISFDCPEGPSEVIHDGQDGFLIPFGNNELMSKQIVKLSKNLKLREQFNRNAFINSKQFSAKEISKKWVRLLKNI